MTFPTDSFGLDKFVREFVKKKKSSIEDFELMQRTFADEKAFRESVDKKLAQLKSSIEDSDTMTTRLTEYRKSWRPSARRWHLRVNA